HGATDAEVVLERVSAADEEVDAGRVEIGEHCPVELPRRARRLPPADRHEARPRRRRAHAPAPPATCAGAYSGTRSPVSASVARGTSTTRNGCSGDVRVRRGSATL